MMRGKEEENEIFIYRYQMRYNMSTMVRILPMDKITEFKNMASDKVQSEFFLKEMPSRIKKTIHGTYQGIYCFKSNKIKTDSLDTYILFQYDNHIIACAKLKEKHDCNEHIEYKGYYVLPPKDIVTFNKINLNDLNTYVFPNDPIKRFSQVCHKRTLVDISEFLNNPIVTNKDYVEKDLIPEYNFQCQP